jgi:hypothetical protein
MQIDESDAQDQNASDSIRESSERASNVTLETNLFREKEWQPNISIPLGTRIASAPPKHLIIEVHSKLTKKWFLILK